MGVIEDRNSKDLTEADEIKNTQKNSTKKKENPNDLDNHDGVITHLEPDILKWEAKWA